MVDARNRQESCQPTGTPPPARQGTEPQVIALYLEEYRALRAEMTQRIAWQAQMTGFAGVVAAFIVSGGGLSLAKPNPYLAVAVLAAALFFWRGNSRMIRRAGGRLQQIENQVNDLAARAYQTIDGPFLWEATIREHRAREGRLGRFRRWLGGG